MITSVFTIGFCAAQILISPQIPPQGLMQKKQLWNIMVVNNSGTPQPVRVQMLLTNPATGEKLLNGVSRVVVIPMGATALREDDFAPVQYNYSGAYSLSDRNTGDLMMAGNYMICYSLMEANPKAEMLLAEECVPTEVAPLSPPQLITPADTSELETSYPSFNWIPPAPLTMFSDLKYELLVTEVKEGQHAHEAIQRNAPLYIQRYLSAPFLLYPSSYKALEAGKKYAWQVIAKSGNTYSQKTETWTFHIKEESTARLIDGGVYTKLSRGYDAHSYICRGNMRFEYFNESGDTTAAVNIYRVQEDRRTPVDQRTVPLKQGQNFIEFNIRNNGKYSDRQVFVLEILNSRREQWNLKFKYLKKD